MGDMFVDISWKVKTTWSILNVMIPSLLEVAGRGDLRCALGWCWSLAEPPGGVQLVLNPALTRLGWVQSSTFCQGQIALPFPPLQSSFRILLVMFRTIPVTADCSVLFPQKKKKKAKRKRFLTQRPKSAFTHFVQKSPFLPLFFSAFSLRFAAGVPLPLTTFVLYFFSFLLKETVTSVTLLAFKVFSPRWLRWFW